jgi:phosphohistidine phosphatase
MDLYLVRHAEAGTADPTKWPDDRDRPVSPQGEKRFRRVARGLRALVPSVDVVLSSRFARAWQTAELLRKEARWPAPIACEALESGRAPADVLLALQAYASSTSVALVGHEPNMHELVSYLLTADTGHAQVDVKKGGVVRLELGDGMRPGGAVLRWLLAPRVLRAI